MDGSYHTDEGGEARDNDEGGEAEQEGSSGSGGGGSSASSTALAVQAHAALQLTPAPAGRSDLVEARSAADYLLHKRTWTGVDSPLVGAEAKPVEAAVQGLAGRAAAYASEPRRGQGSGEAGSGDH